MDSSHMIKIVQALVERMLENAKFDKPAVREQLSEMGWTDWDLEWFGFAWMFEEG